MSIKENLQAIKQGISTEEQFLEGIIKGERFFKKYKKVIIVLLLLVVAGVGYYLVNDYIVKNRTQKANIAYSNLLKDENSTKDLQILKANSKPLYEAFSFQKAMQNNNLEVLKDISKNSKNEVLKDLSSFYVAMSSADASSLASYANKKSLLSEYASLNEVYLLLKNGDVSKAKSKLQSFGYDSSLIKYVNSFKHYNK